jgi:hypothetical protein
MRRLKVAKRLLGSRFDYYWGQAQKKIVLCVLNLWLCTRTMILKHSRHQPFSRGGVFTSCFILNNLDNQQLMKGMFRILTQSFSTFKRTRCCDDSTSRNQTDLLRPQLSIPDMILRFRDFIGSFIRSW